MKGSLLIITIAFSVITNIHYLSGQSTNGLYFDGSNDRVTIPHIPAYDFGTGTFTLEAVIKANVTQTTTYPPILSSRTGTGFNGILFYLFGGNLAIQANGANYISSSGPNLLDGLCHHISISKNSDINTTVYFYVDGILIFTHGQAQNVTNTGTWFLGYDLATNENFTGLIKEVRVWNIFKSTAEILQNKDLQLAGNEVGLVSYWRLDNGTNQVVDDYSISNNDGTLGSNPNIETLDPVSQSSCPIIINSPGPVNAYGNTTFCTGGDVLLVATAPTGSTYQWKKNGANISNITTYKYTAKATGTYSCAITILGVTTQSNTIYVNVLTNPSSFTVNATGVTSFCAGSSALLSITPAGSYTYQWFRGNLGIPGAVNDTFTAFNPGSYKAVVTNTQNGCIRISGAKSIAVTCRLMNPNTFSGAVDPPIVLSVYPNPAQRSFMIEINDDASINQTAKLELINLTGQKIFETTTTITDGNLQYQFDAGNTIADGLYTLIVSSENRKYTSKVVIN